MFIPIAGESNDHYIGNDVGKDLSTKIALMHSWASPGTDWYCFHHDDLTFASDDPYNDPVLLNQLAECDRQGVGVAGVIGTLCLYPSCQWWNPMRPQVTAGAIIQGFSNGQPDVVMADGPGFRTDAVSVDGCCMFFSDRFLQKYEPHNFHPRYLYDVDACLGALYNGFKVAILDYRCRHQSEGKFDPGEFEVARKKFMEYWSPKVDFPVICSSRFRHG